MAFLASAALSLLVPGGAGAQQQTLDDLDRSGWFVRLGAVARFNVKAEIKSITPTLAPGVYDNGFVLPDSGGPGGGLTWNWGFDEDAQAAGGQLVLDRLDDTPTLGKREADVSNPLLGGEVIGGFRFSDLEMGKTKGRFGFEIGFTYSSFSEDVNSTLSGTALRTTDSFGIGGIIPPIAPYHGTAAGPGPLIPIAPGGTMMVMDTPGGTLKTFQSTLEADFYGFRVGPTFEIDLTRRLTLGCGLGYSSVFTDSRLQYDEAVTFTNPGLPALAPNHSTVNDGDWRVGFYTELRLNYRLFRWAELYAGFDFQHNSKFTFGDDRYEATVDLGATYAGKAGIMFSF